MATMAKVTINWTGFPGAPGFTNLFFRDFSGTGSVDQAMVDGAVAKTEAFLTAWRPSLPNSVTTGVDATVEEIEETDGSLVAFWTATVAAPAVGTGGTAYAAPVGAVISWYTNVVRNSRRIRGRTFMVPLSTTSYETDGTLTGGKLTTFNAAAAAMINPAGAGDLGVWSRPSGPAATDGQWAAVASFRIPDMVAILSSRRD